MPRTSRTTISANEIAAKASRGEDVSAHFTNIFTVIKPVRRVNVDLTPGMLRQIDERAARLHISRQAVIKTLLSRAMGKRPARTTGQAGHCHASRHSVQTTATLERKRPCWDYSSVAPSFSSPRRYGRIQPRGCGARPLGNSQKSGEKAGSIARVYTSVACPEPVPNCS